MNAIDYKVIKAKNRKIYIEKKDGKIHVINNDNKSGIIIFSKIFKSTTKYTKVKFDVDMISGAQCSLNLINRKREVIENININTVISIDKKMKYFVAAIIVEPKSEFYINRLEVEYENELDNEYKNRLNGDILVITPGYPSFANKYMCGFVHTRVKAYKKIGWNVDVACIEDYDSTMCYNYEGVDVLRANYSFLRDILQEKKYKTIMIHFFNERYATVLDANDMSETMIYLYCHGADTMYWDYEKMTREYFSLPERISQEQVLNFNVKDEVIKRYNEKTNVKWIFVTEWTRSNSEKLLSLKFKNSEVIPCYIDEDIFKFKNKPAEQRKKIFILRKFDNISSYSMDINVRIILELSKRPFFNDLEFNIYGDGNYHEELISPLLQFSNVNIYKTFLNHERIAEIHSQNGLALFPTRYDSQAVSACEAAMSGVVVITSTNPGIVQFITPDMGTICETEEYIQYADLIEKLYYDEKLFLELSKKMHDTLVSKGGYKQTIEKEIKMLESDSKIKLERYNYKEPSNNILLTVAVPSYNVEKYLKNGIYSLINHELCDKIEVLIINDGSKDNTAKIGKELEELTTINGKSIVKLIDKENGGHGSTINKGIELAKGKYFKLMDGDDYFITSELVKLLKILENETADIVLNNYIEDSSVINIKKTIRHYDFMVPGIEYKMDDMVYKNYGFGKWGPLLSTSTYRTQMLKEANFKLSEKCFYVDMELNLFTYINADTVKYYPLDIYDYYIGRAGQSVSPESFKRNYKNHEKVTLRLVKELSTNKNISYNKKRYLLENTVILMVNGQYDITTYHFKNLDKFFEFDKQLKKYPDIYLNNRISTRKIRLYRTIKNKKIANIILKITGIFERGE